MPSESTKITHMKLYLFNYVNFRGMWRTEERESSRNGYTVEFIEHVKLTDGEWKTEIKSLPSTRKTFSRLKREGGCQLTHIGHTKKKEEIPFTRGEAENYLRSLGYFFSFSKGGLCAPIYAVGFNSNGNRVWGIYPSRKEQWWDSVSWFDRDDSSQIATLFPSFMEKYGNDKWHETLNKAIYWYLKANDPSLGVDIGIILTQAAIEKLFYQWSQGETNSPTASGRLCSLFCGMGIPCCIPAETPILQSLASSRGWDNAPRVLTEIRNALIHAEDRNRAEVPRAYPEA